MRGAQFVEHRSDVERDTSRALRFPIRLAVRYRLSSETDWRDGQIENISSSGVLFRADRAPDLLTRVEMRFDLPVRIAGHAVGIVCRGTVVRIAASSTAESQAAVAATIRKYRFVKEELTRRSA
jgi:hypothetical protein